MRADLMVTQGSYGGKKNDDQKVRYGILATPKPFRSFLHESVFFDFCLYFVLVNTVTLIFRFCLNKYITKIK